MHIPQEEFTRSVRDWGCTWGEFTRMLLSPTQLVRCLPQCCWAGLLARARQCTEVIQFAMGPQAASSDANFKYEKLEGRGLRENIGHAFSYKDEQAQWCSLSNTRPRLSKQNEKQLHWTVWPWEYITGCYESSGAKDINTENIHSVVKKHSHFRMKNVSKLI